MKEGYLKFPEEVMEYFMIGKSRVYELDIPRYRIAGSQWCRESDCEAFADRMIQLIDQDREIRLAEERFGF